MFLVVHAANLHGTISRVNINLQFVQGTRFKNLRHPHRPIPGAQFLRDLILMEIVELPEPERRSRTGARPNGTPLRSPRYSLHSSGSFRHDENNIGSTVTRKTLDRRKNLFYAVPR